MADCSTFRERLKPFLEGSLPPSDADGVAAHVEDCEACGEKLADLALGVGAARLPADPFFRLARPEVAPPPVTAAEWDRRWGAIAAALDLDGVADEKIIRAGERASRLVRRLIPLAASVLVALCAYGYMVSAVHARERAPREGSRFFLEDATFAAEPAELH
jgi:anti-sigma factor RsiW